MKCGKCGKEIGNNQKFCKYCGNPVSAIGDKTSVIKKQGKAKSRKTGKIIIVFITVITVIALVFLVFIGCYFTKQYGLFHRDGKEVEETTPENNGYENPINRERRQAGTEEDEPEELSDDALYSEDAFDSIKNIPRISSTNIRCAVTSSYLNESKYNIAHLPENAIDGDVTTGWAEGVSGQGIGETITIYFDGMYLVSGIEIYAGYQKSDDLYNKNSRPKEMYVEFSDGSGESCTLNDVNNVQNIQFVNPVITESITLRIDSVYPGNKYEDTVITEISPY